MRGSVKWQTGQLARALFEEGVSKAQRMDPGEKQGKISSYRTMETYRDVWNDFGTFAKEAMGVRDFEKVDGDHVEFFMRAKMDEGVSKQYLEKITSALGALERALERFTAEKYGAAKDYDFSQRLEVLHEAKADGLKDGYHDRAYLNPERVIEYLKEAEHRLAAQLQREG